MKRRWVDLLVLMAFLYQQGACCCGSVASHAWVVVCAAAVSTLAGPDALAAEADSCSRHACDCDEHGCGETTCSREACDHPHDPAAEAATAVLASRPNGCSDDCCGGSPLLGHAGYDPAHAHHLCLGFHLFALGLCPLALFQRPRLSWSAFWRNLVPLSFGGRFASPACCAALSAAAPPLDLAPPSQAALQVFRF